MIECDLKDGANVQNNFWHFEAFHSGKWQWLTDSSPSCFVIQTMLKSLKKFQRTDNREKWQKFEIGKTDVLLYGVTFLKSAKDK